MKRIASMVLSLVLCTSALTAFALDWPTGVGTRGKDQGSGESGTAADTGSRTTSRRPWGQIPWEEEPYPDSGKSSGYPGRGYPPSGEDRSWDSRASEPPRGEAWSFGSQRYRDRERDYGLWSQGSEYSPYRREVRPRESPSYRVPRYGEPLSYRDGNYDRDLRGYRRYREDAEDSDRGGDYYGYPDRVPWGDPRAYRAPPRREPWAYGGGYYDPGPRDYSGYGESDWGSYGDGDYYGYPDRVPWGESRAYRAPSRREPWSYGGSYYDSGPWDYSGYGRGYWDGDYYGYPGRGPREDPWAYRAPWWEPGYYADRYSDGPWLDPWDSYRPRRWDPWLRDPAWLDGGLFYDPYL